MTFAGYQVLNRVAQGSSGTVWHAVQLDLGRPVAIKELAPRLLRSPGFLERFRTEARTLAALDDPHVVRVYDYVEELDRDPGEPDRVYLVQEWVDGGPLSDVLLRHGRLVPEQSLGVLRGALTGLAHAHARGLVHGDVSPGNIMVDSTGTSKMVDFGLAVPTGSAGVAGTPTGTPAFSSPEAATGRPVTARSDVYSAAAVLFLLLSGRLPFAGDPAAVLAAHATSPVPRLPDCGPELADLLARAMDKDPAARPADAAELLGELEQAAQRRYGAGWLQRSSMAGLTGASVAAVGVAAVGGGAAGVTGIPVVSTAAGTVTPAFLGGASAQVGAKVFGLPRLAVVLTSTVVVVAAAATAFALTRPTSSDPDEAAGQGPVATGEEAADGGSAATATATPTSEATTTPVPEPAAVFSGTYAVAVTVASISGSVFDPTIGGVQNVTWTVTAACPSGPCAASAASTSGRTFDFSYADGSWSYTDRPSTVECVDSVTGVPIGSTAPSSIDAVLAPTTPVDPEAPMAADELSGTVVETVPAPGCGSGGSVTTSTVVATRTGD